MELAAIKAKLEALNNADQREKVDYSKFFWKPELGKQVVRIVPSLYNPAFPFTELKFHYLIGKYPMLSLSNFGKQDPVEDFIKELKNTSDKDNWSLAGKLTPKTRIFAPVVVREKEKEGVRLWGFGITIYKALLALAEDEDVGDYTDIANGWDLVVEQVKGNPYSETTVRIKPKQSPLSTDKKQVELWLKEQPNPIDCFNHYDYDFIKKQLQTYLSPGEEETPAPTVKEKPATPPEPVSDLPFDLEISPKEKKDLGTTFDDLFKE